MVSRHRDFKPNNVLVGADGRARVVDFGLARVGLREESAEPGPQGVTPSAPVDDDPTGTGDISGTPGYMSPEQYVGGNVDSRSDQWSFAAALYEALYGRLPFTGETMEELAVNVSGRLGALPTNSLVPAEIYYILARALATRQEQRFPSMAELLQVLGHEQGDSPAGAAMSRRRALIPTISATVGLSVIAMLRSIHGLENISQAVVSSLVMLGISAVLCLVLRRTLLRNAFHRRIVLIVLTTVTQNLAQRLIALRLGLSMHTLLPLEMIVWAGGISLIANLLLPALRFLPVVLLATSAAAVFLPRTAAPIFGLVYPLIVIALAFAWTGARPQADRTAVPARRGVQYRDGQSGIVGTAETPMIAQPQGLPQGKSADKS